MAGVTRGLNEVVEKHCELLTSKHVEKDAAQRMIQMAKFKTSHEPRTLRACWLEIIDDRCGFCKKTGRTIATEIGDMDTVTTLTKYMEARNKISRDRLRKIAGSPFNHDILCCGFCELEQWPRPICLRDATSRFGLPAYFLLFPFMSLQVGQRDRSYKSEMVSTYCLDHYDNWESIYFLEAEVEVLMNMVKADPKRYVPYWMVESPRCIQDVAMGH
jgi:hypothetical protein